jgi:hypothetical protein
LNSHPLLEGHHITYEKDGDILVFQNRQWSRVGAGSAGQVLQIVSGLPAWVSEPAVSITAITTVLSADFAIDAVAVVTVTTAHGLSVTPAIQDVQVTLSESANGNVDDFALGYIKVESVDATNVVVKVNVTTASATAGAKAKLNIFVVTGV